MTNSMRWGLVSLTALGLLVAGGAFVGCSSSSDNPVVEDTGTPGDDAADTGTDTSTPDTTPADTGSDVHDGDTAEAAPPSVPDRTVTIVHAAPDAGKQLFCFGAGASNTLALATIMGVPGAGASPSDRSKFEGFPYGAIVPITLPNDAYNISTSDIKTAENLTIYAFPIGATNPLASTPNPTVTQQTAACSTIFNTFKSDAGIDTTKFIAVPSKTILAGTSTLLYAYGCTTAGAALPQCAGKPMTLGYKQLDLSDPTWPTGDAAPANKVVMHFFHASPFPGVTGAVPSWQGIDVYLMPMSAGVAGTDAGPDGDTGAVASQPTGTPVMIANNVSFGDIGGAKAAATGDAGAPANPGAAFAVPAGTADVWSYLVVLPHGATFCQQGATGCTAAWFPLGGAPIGKPGAGWLDVYKLKATGGGLPAPGFVNGSHQLLVFSGAPAAGADPTANGLNLGWGNVSKP